MTDAQHNDSDEAEAVRAEIAETRAELAETVNALTDKLDVKQHAADRVADAKEKVAQTCRARETVRAATGSTGARHRSRKGRPGGPSGRGQSQAAPQQDRRRARRCDRCPDRDPAQAGESMKALYQPIGLLFSVLGGLVASALFKQVWRAVAGEDDAPDAKDRERSWGEVLAAAALQGAVFATVKALVDRAGATGFERATGTWPGNTAEP